MSSALNKLTLSAWPGPRPRMSHLLHLVVTEAFRMDEIGSEGQESEQSSEPNV